METLMCRVCSDDFLVRPGEEEWQKRTCTNCLDEQQAPVKTRDLHADLEAVEKFENGYIPGGPNDNDRAIWGYFLFAREGWPEAIRRALAAEAENERLREALMNVYQKARNDVARWGGGQCVGTQTFSDRTFARRIVRDIEPLLFPEVVVDET